MEVKLNLAYWTITVLGDNKIGNILHFWIIRLVISGTIDKAYDIGILLNGSGLAKVG